MERYTGRLQDLGEGFVVRRTLPRAQRRQLGPWVFLDAFGPVDLQPGQLAVAPHPHIGLSTVSYLFAGRIVHRDSLGNHVTIEPGAIALMTAGRGIVHSERSEDHTGPMHGLQLWLALPDALQDMEPTFEHTPKEALPTLSRDGSRLVLAIGSWLGRTSPVTAHALTLFAEVALEGGLDLPREHEELGVYVIQGDVRVDGESVQPGTLVICTGAHLRLEGSGHLVVLGGSRVGARRMSWNFVHSDPERIEQARQDWAEHRFPLVPGDEDERIELP